MSHFQASISYIYIHLLTQANNLIDNKVIPRFLGIDKVVS